MGIKHILYENGVKEFFKLIIPNGDYAGTYEIEKPDGWDDIDSKVNIDKDLFFVKDFIIGDAEKIRFMEFEHHIAYGLLKNVYEEQKGDAVAIFKWFAEKDSVEYDILKENFVINFNKYDRSFEKSMFKIEVEIIKSEEQNKLFNREETTINLFDEKDLDENDITPVSTFEIGYKKGSKVLENFYFATAGQERGNLTNESNKFYVFSKSESNELESSNPQSGIAAEDNGNKQAYFGPFLVTPITLTSVKLSLSTFDIGIYTTGTVNFHDVAIYAVIKTNGIVENILIPGTEAIDAIFTWQSSTITGGRITFDNIEFTLPYALKPGSSIDLYFLSGVPFKTILLNESASVTISSNLESPIVRTDGIRIFDALNQVIKNCTASELSLESNILNIGGYYYNTAISTGIYLRGLPPVYNTNKIKTSLKSLLSDGASKLMALGYDILDDKVVIEDISYFFKDFKVYDLSEKQFLWEDFNNGNDEELSFNTLLLGSKKYSTDKKDDIKNFNTVSESSTPIKSVKSKFDKQTEMIIDEYKIQELIEDSSSKTNDNDDDLVLIDMVDVVDYWDKGLFENTTHSSEGGFLWLSCIITPFDTTLMEVGNLLEIQEVINAGTWEILEIDTYKIKLNKTTGIVAGNVDTPIRYKIDSLTKNRTSEGFTDILNIRNPDSATNIRHNPKYQMARWFPYFGSGMRRKGNTEIIKTTNYKNNDIAQMKCNSIDLANELQDLVIVGSDEPLSRFRSYAQTFFNGDKIEISYINVTFEEFLDLYNNWKFGVDDNRLQSRGYISLNTPDGIYDAYPFGDSAFSHDRKTNVLSIKAKLKGKSVDNPTLLNVTQIDKDNVSLVWDYSDDFVDSISVVQYSLDGIYWSNLESFLNSKSETITNDIFGTILTGETVYFRVVVSSADYSNKKSNTLAITWAFNDWVVKEISRTENIYCGYSYLTLEFKGTADFDLEFNFYSLPGGGKCKILNAEDLSTISDFIGVDGLEDTDTDTYSFSIVNETKQIVYQLQNATKTVLLKPLTCVGGNMAKIVYSSIETIINDGSTTKTILLECEIEKKWFKHPTMP